MALAHANETSPGRPPAAHWSRAFQNLPREHGFEPLRVEGTIPAELNGTFYGNGIGRVDCFGERYGHWFDGDGAVTGVRFQGGRASGGVKLVQTPAFAREQRAGRRLFGGYNTPLRRPFRELLLNDLKTCANTSMVLWQDRLFALSEAGLPFEIDGDDLATLGERDLEGVLVRAFSAHPHAVPQRRALYGFGIAKMGPQVTLAAYELPAAGRPRPIVELKIPGPTAIHDFAATERHLVFTIPPMRFSLLSLLFRRRGLMDSLVWRADEGTEIIVVPIDDPGATFRVRTPAHMSEHVVNAFEEGGTLQFDFTRYDDMRGLEGHVGKLIAGIVEAPLASTLSRCIIDLKGKKVRFEERLSAPCELPRVSPRVDAAAYRYCYLVGHSSREVSGQRFFNAILKVDMERGQVERFVAGPSQLCGEAVFVPRREPVAEDDGYLVTMMSDVQDDRTCAAVFDARSVEAGPIARAWFDHAIPPGFHGQWAARG